MEDAMRAQERHDGEKQGSLEEEIDEPDDRRAEKKSDLVRRVTGVLDSDKRIILNNCLVGRCNKSMHAHILAEQLHDEGITGASIMNISGSNFLMIFKDRVSMENFRKKHEEALRKWFSEVQVWVEDFSVCYRRAWIACHGVPIHAWSVGTFGNIATLWGDIISIDERTLKPTSFYRAYFQILTRFPERINETVELVIGSKVFRVFVSEIEPTFSPNSLWCEEAESSENCTSMNSKENQRMMEARQTTRVDVESRGALTGLLDKRVTQGNEFPKEALVVQLDLQGVNTGVENRVETVDGHRLDPLEPNAISEDCQGFQQQPAPLSSIAANIDQELCSKEPNDSFEINPGLQNGSLSVPRATSVADKQMIDGFEDIEEESHGVSDFGNSQAVEDIRCMGLGSQESLAEKVDKANSANHLFPEMQDVVRKASKKYSSMLVLQDKAISVKEIKRRDQAIKRVKEQDRKTSLWKSRLGLQPTRTLRESRFSPGSWSAVLFGEDCSRQGAGEYETFGMIKDASRGRYLERTGSKFDVSLVTGAVLFR
ncbi:hypothetical protein V6N12_036356 [Hibiscus sabdariffa]|uniref:DUF4283 domain-containing protein n=1 Tax=Hibiscus sabdariffa TaxID=183260 RepID=A0ABR2ESY8_9ROSI